MEPFDFIDQQLGRSVVPHIMQEQTWDCGLACVAMVLRAMGGYAITLPELARQVPSEDVWTIDLCYLLAHHAEWLDFTYYTAYLGANPKHLTTTRFYEGTAPNDLVRVDKMFLLAKRHNISIIRLTLPLDDFKRFLLHRKFSIITLVNAELLKCEHCLSQSKSRTYSFFSFARALACWQPCKPCQLRSSKSTTNYSGHFIVLIGYDLVSDSFIYRDPAQSENFCTIKADLFDIARTSQGTDDDR